MKQANAQSNARKMLPTKKTQHDLLIKLKKYLKIFLVRKKCWGILTIPRTNVWKICCRKKSEALSDAVTAGKCVPLCFQYWEKVG